MFRRYRLRDYNFRLILWLAAISAMGVLLMRSAMESLLTKQFLGVIAGLVLMVFVSMIDYSWVLHFHWVIYFFNLIMLLSIIAIGAATNGATRWLDIGGFRFQPVEVSKILLIVFFGWYFMEHENDLSRPGTIIRAVALIGAPLALIFMQPDLKNTLTILVLFAVLYFSAGLSFKAILIILAILIPIGAGGATVAMNPDSNLLRGYQLERIMTFSNPDDEAYSEKAQQQKNSVIAIGSGELTGKGLNNSDVNSANKGNFISEIQTDFIFAVVGEELGFLGGVAIILLYLLIVFECLLMSRRAKDLAGRVIASGMACIVSLQSFINIGVATGILPNTGTPLPFISYGLTSLISLFIGMGFVLNIGMQGKIRLGGKNGEKAG